MVWFWEGRLTYGMKGGNEMNDEVRCGEFGFSGFRKGERGWLVEVDKNQFVIKMKKSVR